MAVAVSAGLAGGADAGTVCVTVTVGAADSGAADGEHPVSATSVNAAHATTDGVRKRGAMPAT
ncbi:hypothetical protein C5C12_16700 [Pseudoclavibacter sp. RFBJ5]|nr:hypothetical protein C5C12_16700 [Pseudoclavibacter sp. RFBJ5]PPF99546.1 hypothetical protein C5C19_04885 [Pseudoclavibacter sp. RFBH5]